ncbi:MAG TPA: TonB-dependent receptor [Bacteroidales bacterium]|nr:TonB-dependent receptor [Bacteroidales bacterium]
MKLRIKKLSNSIRFLLPLILLFIFNNSFAQLKLITGKVTDAADNSPLPGVNITVKGTTIGISTDFNGDYSISVPGDETILVFSFIGYEKVELPVKGKSVIDVSLRLESTALDEIVVIGYGSIKKSDLTGSVSSVKGADLTKITSSSLEQSLQGKVAGLQVSNVSGAPGSIPIIRVRGVGTLNNSSPIFVVDGIILDDISFLNSADIESVEVLKDASATAIYGSRGANGVIMVTSKSGSALKGSVIHFSSEYSLQYLQKKIDLLSGYEFAQVVNEINPGTYNNLDKVPNTDWQDEVFQTYAPVFNAQLSFSGSTAEKYNYYLGIGYFDQDGIIPKSAYNRISIKLNQAYILSKNVKIGSIISLSSEKKENAADVVSQIYRAWPSYVPKNEDGTFTAILGVGNPLASIEYNNSNENKTRAVGNLFGEINFLKYFIFKSSYGLDISNKKTKSFTPVYFVTPTQLNVSSDLFVNYEENYTWLWENTLNFNYDIDSHTFNMLGGYTMQKNTIEKIGGNVQNLAGNDPAQWYLNAGDIESRRGENSGEIYSMISYILRANYSFESKYLATASVRADGSSKFNKENRYGYFPSFAIGWNLAKENFFPKDWIVDNLKLRGSWGKIGNEKIDYYARFSTTINNQNAVFGTDEKLNAGMSLDQTADPYLRWESTTQTDIGLELGFWRSKFTAEFDVFDRKTEDILVGVTSPGYYGNGAFTKIITNAADVRNMGIEFNLGLHSKIGNINAHFYANGSLIQNEVLSLAATTGNDSFISGGELGNGQQVTRTEVGRPIGSFYGYQVIGIIQNQDDLDNSAIVSGQTIGDLKFKDIYPDGIIDEKDRTYIGSPIPDFIFGFGTTLKYKQFTLAIDLQGQTGNELYNGKNAVRPDLYNFESRVNDRWSGDGTSNTEPRATASGANYSASSYFIEDGSFLRIRNVSLEYSFQTEALDKINISQLSIYLKGANLYTFTKFSGYTPEIGSSDVINAGIDFGTYPVTAIISFGISCTF